MNRLETFSFRVTSGERQLLVSLAHYYRRSKSDALRFLLHEKAQQLGLENNFSDTSNETPISSNRELASN